MNIDDPIELIIADGLTRAGIKFERPQSGLQFKTRSLDFLLTDYGVYIECKQFPTDRTIEQIAQFPNVIVIQGRAAAELFVAMINHEPFPTEKDHPILWPWITIEDDER